MTYTFAPYDVLQVLRGGDWLDFSTLRTAEDADTAVRYVTNDGRDFGQDAPFRITDGRDTIKLEKPPTAAQMEHEDDLMCPQCGCLWWQCPHANELHAAEQPALPGAEDVQNTENPTPTFTAPDFSLTPTTSTRTAKQEGLF